MQNKMKSSKAKETCEFSIDSTQQLNCQNGDSELNRCGSCHSCILSVRLSGTTEWFLRAGDALKMRFLTAVFVHCQRVDVLKNIERLLQATLGKDFTYSRSSHKPTSREDLGIQRTDKELDFRDIVETWKWFRCSQYWIKTKYVLGLLSLCNTRLLHILGNIIRVLTVRGVDPFLRHCPTLDNHEDDGIPDCSKSSFSSEDCPELDLLFRDSSHFALLNEFWYWGAVDILPVTGFKHDPEHEDNALPEPSRSVSEGMRNETLGEGWKNEGCDAGSLSSEHPVPAAISRFSHAFSRASSHRDFIRSLPVHLAKRILGLLDKASLRSCLSVSQHWCYLAKEVQLDVDSKRMLDNRAMIMQGSSSLGISSAYTRIQEVLIPIREEEQCQHCKELVSDPRKVEPQCRVFEALYTGLKTSVIQMEERNVYCGIYEVQLLSDREDPMRVVDFCGGELVVLGSREHVVRLLKARTARAARRPLCGHVGSIHAVLLCEERDLVVSAGYDLSIRCWNLRTGACTMLFCGHTDTVNCLGLHDNRLVSGAKDCRVKVWNMQTGRCCDKLKFKHSDPVLCVKISASVVLSSCEKGLVKMWEMDTASLIKMIDGHQGPVRCLFFDQWHILSGGADGYAMAWSTSSHFKACLMSYRHPREVMTLTFLYLRVITGCMDGKIRIFNFLSGDCLRVIRANSQQSPVLSLHAHNDNIVINTTSNVLLLQFKKVVLDHSLSSDPEFVDRAAWNSFSSADVQNHSRTRAKRTLTSSGQKIHSGFSTAAASTPGPCVERAQNLKWWLISKPPSAPSSKRQIFKRSSSAPGCASMMPNSAATSSSKGRHGTAEWVLSRSEQAVRERIRKRGLHHSITPERFFLMLNSATQSQRSDPASCNMELNAGIRDAWGPQLGVPGRDPVTMPSLLWKQHSSLPSTGKVSGAQLNQQLPLCRSVSCPRSVQPQTDLCSSGPPPQLGRGGQRLRSSELVSKATLRGMSDVSTTALPTSALPRILLQLPRKHVEFELPITAAPRTGAQPRPLDPFRQHSPFQLLTSTQLEKLEQVQVQQHDEDIRKDCDRRRLSEGGPDV